MYSLFAERESSIPGIGSGRARTAYGYAEAAAAEARKIAAERGRLLAAAQAANRAKDEFLGILSHELRTPLAAMLGWVSLLRRGTLPAERARRALEVIERNTLAQAQLVEDLLDVTRIAAGKMEIEHVPVDLGAVVVAAVEDCRPAAQAKGVELSSSVERLPCEVLGDEKRLRQVVSNLLGNAIKFTPGGGRVAVTLTCRDGEAVVAVVDTGDGIAADYLRLIFDRFFQADSSYRRKAGGLGLGLSIVKRLTELHGGSIEAKSDGLAKGATFTVRLPLAPSVAKDGDAAPDPGDARPDLYGATVLLVDDDADVREVLALAFEQRGIRVYACGSAAEALEVADRVAIDRPRERHRHARRRWLRARRAGAGASWRRGRRPGAHRLRRWQGPGSGSHRGIRQSPRQAGIARSSRGAGRAAAPSGPWPRHAMPRRRAQQDERGEASWVTGSVAGAEGMASAVPHDSGPRTLESGPWSP